MGMKQLGYLAWLKPDRVESCQKSGQNRVIATDRFGSAQPDLCPFRPVRSNSKAIQANTWACAD